MGHNVNFDIDIDFELWSSGRSSLFGSQAAEPDTNSELADILSLTYPSQRSAGSLDYEVFQQGRRASSPSLTSTTSCAGQAASCSERHADADLARSSRLRSTTRRHRCLKCDETFDTGDALEQHTIALRHASFACSMKGCKKAYSRRDACTRHISAGHLVAPKEACPLCQRGFKRKDHLRRHMRIQHVQKPSKPAKKPEASEPEIKKVKESEHILRQQLPEDNLAIKMLNIAGEPNTGITEEGAQKAFALIVACAALNADEPLPDRTKQRLNRLLKLEPEKLEIEASDLGRVVSLKPG